MLIIRGVGVEPGYLYSWLRRFDAARGVKTPVLGFCRFDTGTREVRVLIVDDEKAIQGIWCLGRSRGRAQGCRSWLARCY